MTVRIEHGHVIDRLRAMPAESVQCVITSVPYYGLRSYKTEPQIFGGNERCAHEFADVDGRLGGGKHTSAKARWQHDAKNRPHGHAKTPQSAFCEWCGAWRGEHGLEPTVDLWLAHEVLIWREIRRVLRKDGCAWLNVGDSYAGGGRGADTNSTLEGSRDSQQESRVAVRSRGSQANAGLHERARSAGALNRAWTPPPQGFKAKQRLMLPSRLALALQDDGWWIRDEIVWHKPNPMPSSVDDRTTPAHEMIYLLSKRARYFFDAAAIAEPFSEASIARLTQANIPNQMGGERQDQFDIEGYNNNSRRPNEIVAALSQKISRVPSGWDPDNHDTIGHSERESQNGTRRIDAGARSEGEPYGSNPPNSRRNSFARAGKAGAGECGQKPQHRTDREPISYGRSGNKERKLGEERGRPDSHLGGSIPWEGVTRNKRSVWTIPTEPFPDAHFATFPTKLVEPMILAGTSAKGACVACGAPWARVKVKTFHRQADVSAAKGVRGAGEQKPLDGSDGRQGTPRGATVTETTGWKPTCKCTDAGVRPCIVLDPFLGSGTTALVAERLRRDTIGIELNGDYVQMAMRRLRDDCSLFTRVESTAGPSQGVELADELGAAHG